MCFLLLNQFKINLCFKTWRLIEVINDLLPFTWRTLNLFIYVISAIYRIHSIFYKPNRITYFTKIVSLLNISANIINGTKWHLLLIDYFKLLKISRYQEQNKKHTNTALILIPSTYREKITLIIIRMLFSRVLNVDYFDLLKFVQCITLFVNCIWHKM